MFGEVFQVHVGLTTDGLLGRLYMAHSWVAASESTIQLRLT
jgi:hypothetical protein